MQFDLRTMAEHKGGVAWGVVIVLALRYLGGGAGSAS